MVFFVSLAIWIFPSTSIWSPLLLIRHHQNYYHFNNSFSPCFLNLKMLSSYVSIPRRYTCFGSLLVLLPSNSLNIINFRKITFLYFNFTSIKWKHFMCVNMLTKIFIPDYLCFSAFILCSVFQTAYYQSTTKLHNIFIPNQIYCWVHAVLFSKLVIIVFSFRISIELALLFLYFYCQWGIINVYSFAFCSMSSCSLKIIVVSVKTFCDKSGPCEDKFYGISPILHDRTQGWSAFKYLKLMFKLISLIYKI